MKSIQTRAWLAAAVAAALLAGCNQSDNASKAGATNPGQAQAAASSAPYNPVKVRAEMPPQFPDQSKAPNDHGTKQQQPGQ